jgi:hypothetical protein
MTCYPVTFVLSELKQPRFLCSLAENLRFPGAEGSATDLRISMRQGLAEFVPELQVLNPVFMFIWKFVIFFVGAKMHPTDESTNFGENVRCRAIFRGPQQPLRP